MDVFFYQIYLWVQRKKIISCVIVFLFLIICTFLASKIRFEEDVTAIIPNSQQSEELSRVLSQINFADKITILIEKTGSGDFGVMAEMARQFVDSTSVDTSYIRAVTGAIGQSQMADAVNFVYQNLPFILDQSDYTVIQQKLTRDSLRSQIESNYRRLISPEGMFMRDMLLNDPLGLTTIGLKKMQYSAVGDNFILANGYISTLDSNKLLLFIDPKYQGTDTEHNTFFVDHLNDLKKQLNEQYQDRAEISYYGAPFVAVANAKQIKKDISTTVVVSMSVLMVLLVLFYRRIYVPLLVFIPTVCGTLFALACLYLYKPIISAVSLSIGAVLIGITIDFALHLLTHYKKSANPKMLFKELTRPLLMSGACNALAFLCLLFVHSEALVDLGIFASICIFSSAVFSLLIIPHLYHPKEQLRHSNLIDKIASFPFDRSKILIAVCLVLIFGSIFSSGRVSFNKNIADLNFVPPDLRLAESKLDSITSGSTKSLYLVSTGKSFEDAARQSDTLLTTLKRTYDQGIINAYQGFHILPLSKSAQQYKIEQWNNFWTPAKKRALIEELLQEEERYGFSSDAHQSFFELLDRHVEPLSFTDYQTLSLPGFTDYIAERDSFYTISTLVKLPVSNKDTFVKQINKEHKVLVVDRQHLNETFLGQLRNDFNRLIGYSFLAVLLILWCFFKKIELVLLSAIPIGLTGLVTTGLMGVFGLEFNIFSAIVCTLVFGHGVDFSIFMTAALQQQYTTGKDELQTYRTSILLAVLTTVLAVGALVFAKHPALLSIASVSLIGVFAAVIITFVFYPMLFRFFISDRAKKGQSPFTIIQLLLSLAFFAYYGIGSFLISIFGSVMHSIFPRDKMHKELFFRGLIVRFMNSVLSLNPRVKRRLLNPTGERFQRPAIIIANHSSFLDTLSMATLVPKSIFLVNDWVWNSPIFGRAVRLLGAYPVNNGLEDGIEVLRHKVENGYSLIVFPEGTRSYDNEVRRFHKGAFYLAEKLSVDILPVYLLGNGDVLPKGDILIHNGVLTQIVGSRIGMLDRTFGEGYSERTKLISHYFRAQYADYRSQEQDHYYFHKKILLAYRYKHPSIQRMVEKNLSSFASFYEEVDQQLGNQVSVVHFSDSVGELDYLLSLKQGRRKVYGLIEDPERNAIAKSIYWNVHRNIIFLRSADGLQGYPLVIHPNFTASCLPIAQLHTFSEIYTFRQEDKLTENGWTESRVSGMVYRYFK